MLCEWPYIRAFLHFPSLLFMLLQILILQNIPIYLLLSLSLSSSSSSQFFFSALLFCSASSMDSAGHYNPRTVEEVFRDFKGRRTGMIKALTTGLSL